MLVGFDQVRLGELETVGHAFARLRQRSLSWLEALVAGAAPDRRGFPRGDIDLVSLPIEPR
jgi:hypothetical protein